MSVAPSDKELRPHGWAEPGGRQASTAHSLTQGAPGACRMAGKMEGMLRAQGSTRCFGLNIGLLFSLQSLRIKAAQECPAGAGGFDAAAEGPLLLILKVTQPIHRLRGKAFLNDKDLKVDWAQLPP